MPPGEAAMLDRLGIQSVDDLFADIPPEVRIKGLELPAGMEEAAAVLAVQRLLDRNETTEDLLSFLGGGVYDMYVPAVVDAIVGRSEFYTAYTPYQAEMSQGLQQALFEYQSLIAELTGMDAANSSMYDASSALGEAALMAHRLSRRREFVVPRALHWQKRAVLENYARGARLRIREVDLDPESGSLDLAHLERLVGPETGGIYVELPSLFGLLDEGILQVADAYPDPLLVVGINPLAQGILRPPGEFGADIVIGEGQALGGSLNLGGPSLGIFACRKEYVRKMPGRVIGLTADRGGRRSFCMTLQTREQHIRRERATSNICTNEALLAIGAAVYLAHLGADGLRQLGIRLVKRARDLMARLSAVEGFEAPAFPGAYFNEFPVRAHRPWTELQTGLRTQGIIGGIDLTAHFPDLGALALYAVTDRHRQEDFDRLADALGGRP